VHPLTLRHLLEARGMIGIEDPDAPSLPAQARVPDADSELARRFNEYYLRAAGLRGGGAPRLTRTAFVIPWFGQDLIGGAEQHIFQVATRLAKRGHPHRGSRDLLPIVPRRLAEEPLARGRSPRRRA